MLSLDCLKEIFDLKTFVNCFQVEVKRALPKEVQQQQAALRAAVAGRGMIGPATIGEPGMMLLHVSFELLPTS